MRLVLYKWRNTLAISIGLVMVIVNIEAEAKAKIKIKTIVLDVTEVKSF